MSSVHHRRHAVCVNPKCGAWLSPKQQQCRRCGMHQFGRCAFCESDTRTNELTDGGLCTACAGVTLDAYGVTREEWQLYRWPDWTPVRLGESPRTGESELVWWVVVLWVAVFGGTAYVAGQAVVFFFGQGELLGYGVLAVLVLAAWLATLAVKKISALIKEVSARITRHQQGILMASPAVARIQLYEEARIARYQARETNRERIEQQRAAERAAERARREVERVHREAEQARLRKEVEFWESLSGAEFERELASLFIRVGYQVEMTPMSRDEGVDLVLKRNGKIGIVQCKRYAQPAGPAIARELLGSMVAYHADYAVLACTGGFTQGVHEFVRDKELHLMSVHDIVQLSERGETAPQPREIPTQQRCPLCRAKMVLRVGKYGTFLGCTRWPKCKGSRNLQGSANRWDSNR